MCRSEYFSGFGVQDAQVKLKPSAVALIPPGTYSRRIVGSQYRSTWKKARAGTAGTSDTWTQPAQLFKPRGAYTVVTRTQSETLAIRVAAEYFDLRWLSAGLALLLCCMPTTGTGTLVEPAVDSVSGSFLTGVGA